MSVGQSAVDARTSVVFVNGTIHSMEPGLPPAETAVTLASDDRTQPMPALGGAAVIPPGFVDTVGAGASHRQFEWLSAWARGATHAGTQLDERSTIIRCGRADFVIADITDDRPPVDVTWIDGRNALASTRRLT